MTAKERWKAVLARKGVDRLPVDYWGTGETSEKLRKALGAATDEEVWRRLGIDKSRHVWAHDKDPRAKRQDGTNIWGVKTRTIAYADGSGTYDEVAFSPLAAAQNVRDIENFPWPDPGWFSVDHLKAECESLKEWPVIGGSYEPFLLYCYMRGIQRAMEDLAEEPEMVEAALERIMHFHYDTIERSLQAAQGGIDIIYVAEDMGTQESLLFSPAMFRRFLKPGMKKMIDLAHQYGAAVQHHNDGAIRPLLPEIVDLGIDILNPIQWRCPGMDRAELKRTFGDRIVFHGGLDNQKTLPFGTVEDVRQEVRDNARLLGQGGGYILAPCHNIQPITPVENILAMYDEAKRVC